LDLKYSANSRNSAIVNYNIGFGSSFILKNYSLIKVGLLANISFTPASTGCYYFDNIGSYTAGKQELSMSYIGLKFGYVFTGGKKLKKLIDEKQLTE